MDIAQVVFSCVSSFPPRGSGATNPLQAKRTQSYSKQEISQHLCCLQPSFSFVDDNKPHIRRCRWAKVIYLHLVFFMLSNIRTILSENRPKQVDLTRWEFPCQTCPNMPPRCTCSPYWARFHVFTFTFQHPNRLYVKRMRCVLLYHQTNSNRTLYSNSRTLEDGGVLTGMSARLSTFTGSSRKPRGSHTGNSQRREEVTFLK